MATIDPQALAQEMLTAALPVLQKKTEAARTYAEPEFKKIAETILGIENGRLEGRIGEEEARLLLDMQKNAARAVLLTVEGLGLLTVEAAINAALGAVRTAVNTAMGFSLL